MKTLVLLAIMLTASAAAAPPAPTAAQVADWAGFPKPVTLQARDDKGNHDEGDAPVWMFGYSAKKQTYTTYEIFLFKAGTLDFMGSKRDAWEKTIGRETGQFKQIAAKQKNPPAAGDETANVFRIETRPDGRKVYFSAMMGAPGAGCLFAFTTIGQYDVLLEQSSDDDPDLPADQRIKDPAIPTKQFGEVFKQLEQRILNSK